MVSQKVVIKNPTGLHLRPAGILCKEAMQFKSLITFKFRENTANAKSVLSVLGACIKCGDEIELICEGIDEQEAGLILRHQRRRGQAGMPLADKEFEEGFAQFIESCPFHSGLIPFFW